MTADAIFETYTDHTDHCIECQTAYESLSTDWDNGDRLCQIGSALLRAWHNVMTKAEVTS